MMSEVSFNLDIKLEWLMKFLTMENVQLVPVCRKSVETPDDCFYYRLNNGEYQGKKETIDHLFEVHDETIMIPIVTSYAPTTPCFNLPETVAQRLYLHDVINMTFNNIFKQLHNESLNKYDITMALSILDKNYSNKYIGRVYPLESYHEDKRDSVVSLYNQFVDKLGLTSYWISPTYSTVRLSVEDKINIYDIAKFRNYIKLKGFVDDKIQIELEADKNVFDTYNIRREMLSWITYFFEV